jgi:hypothetical protein
MITSLLIGALIVGGGEEDAVKNLSPAAPTLLAFNGGAVTWPLAAMGKPKVIEGFAPGGFSPSNSAGVKVIEGAGAAGAGAVPNSGGNRAYRHQPRTPTGPPPRDINHVFNPTTVVTANGPLLGIKSFPFEKDTDYTVLTINVRGELPHVILGPSKHLDDRQIALGIGDPVQVTGSWIRWRGQLAMLAKELTIGGNSVVFREDSGKPMWAGAPEFYEDETPQLRPWPLRFDPAPPLGRTLQLSGPILGMRFVPLDDDKTGLIIEVHSGGEIPPVFVGDTDFLEQNNVKLDIANFVTVRGRQTKLLGQPLIIAETLKIGDQELNLPVWPPRQTPPPQQTPPAPSPGEGSAE